jgi:hypothetical protein
MENLTEFENSTEALLVNLTTLGSQSSEDRVEADNVVEVSEEIIRLVLICE